MTDDTTPPVSMSKPVGDSAAKPQPPRTIVGAAATLVVAGVCGVIAALILLSQKNEHSWLYHSIVKSNNKKKPKDRQTTAQLIHSMDNTVRGQIIAAVVFVLILGYLAYSAYRGKHWTRWAVIGIWIISVFTGSLVGLTGILSVGSDEPASLKLPAFVGAVAFIGAVVLVSLRPSVAFLHLSRPIRPEGAPQRRGLFAPRDPTMVRGRAAGRTRARASKSRRTE